ncbi:hypothetical protein LTR10_009578 [Elasticomyces elasticus]|nr:hypothetical protein LTR10_009578 [Elasticomyces elasticus]KAK4971327.1 hypothetical protein LTR42_007053 [Elasticomyces elasticus]
MILVHETSTAAIKAFDRAVDERIFRYRFAHPAYFTGSSENPVNGSWVDGRKSTHKVVAVQIERALRRHDAAQRDMVQGVVDASIEASHQSQQIDLPELIDTRSQQLYSTQKAALLDEIQRLNTEWEHFFERYAADQQDTLRRIVDDQTKTVVEQKLAVSNEKLIPTVDARINEIQDDQRITQQKAFEKLVEDKIQQHRTHDLAAKQIADRAGRQQLYTSLGKALVKLQAHLNLYVQYPQQYTHTHCIVLFIQAALTAYGALEAHAPSISVKILCDQHRALKDRLADLAHGEYAAHTKAYLPSILDAVVAMSTSTESVLQENINNLLREIAEQPELAATVRLFLFLYIFTIFVFVSVAMVIYHWEPISQSICKISESTVDALHAYVKQKVDAGKRDLEAKSPSRIKTHEQDRTVKTVQMQNSSIRDQNSAATTAHRASLFLALGNALDDIVDRFPHDHDDMARLTHTHGIARLLDRAITALNNIMVDSYDLWSDELADTRIDLEKALGSLDSQGCSVPDATSQSELLELRVQVIEIFRKSFEDEGKPVLLGVGLRGRLRR